MAPWPWRSRSVPCWHRRSLRLTWPRRAIDTNMSVPGFVPGAPTAWQAPCDRNILSVARSYADAYAALSQRPGVLLQDLPRRITQLGTPALVEPPELQPIAKTLRADVVEHQPLALQLRLHRLVAGGDVDALQQRRRVQVARHDLLQIVGQPGPGGGIGAQPVAVPHMVGQRAVFLYLVELRRLDQGQRVFLRIGDMGLQRRV